MFNVTSIIDYTTESNPVIRVQVVHNNISQSYCMSLREVPKSRHEWNEEVMVSNIKAVIEQVETGIKKDLRKKAIVMLDVVGIQL